MEVMIDTADPLKTTSMHSSSFKNKPVVDCHRKTAGYLVAAARHYLEAAKYEEAGDNKKAYESTTQAEGILLLALTFRVKI